MACVPVNSFTLIEPETRTNDGPNFLTGFFYLLLIFGQIVQFWLPLFLILHSTLRGSHIHTEKLFVGIQMMLDILITSAFESILSPHKIFFK